MGAGIASLLVSQQPQPRTVELPDGSRHELHFKQLPAAAFRRFFNALQDKNEDAQSRAMAGLIASALCDAEGQPAITVEQALQLTPAAERALSDALMEVNGLGARQERELGNGLPAAATSGSGTS